VLAQQAGSAVSGVAVTIGSTGGVDATCSISGSATTDGTGTATLASISSSAPGKGCELTAAAPGFTSATSSPFDVLQQLGVLTCTSTGTYYPGHLNPDAVPDIGSADWGLRRGLNTDNTTCIEIPFTLNVYGDNSALFTEDSLGQKTSVEYIIRWNPVDVDGDVWSAKQPCVSWGVTNHYPPVYQTDDDGVCVGDFVPALACVTNNVSGGTAVMPTIPTGTYPFNDAVESSYDQYQPGQTAKVCVAQQGWTSDNGQVQYWHKFIDQSDTGIRLP
jgi:hypothetical protein